MHVIGAIGGAAVGATSGAIAIRISTGSWKNSGTAALKWGAVGFTTGAIAGAAIGAGAYEDVVDAHLLEIHHVVRA